MHDSWKRNSKLQTAYTLQKINSSPIVSSQPFNLLKQQKYPELQLKVQLVPHSKHAVSVMKIHQLISRCVRKTAKRNYELRHVCLCLSVRPSVCLSAWNNSGPIGRISAKFDIWVILESNSYCRSTVTMVARTHRDVTFVSKLPVLYGEKAVFCWELISNIHMQFADKTYYFLMSNLVVYKVTTGL
jgi:hypothetical protein